MNEQRGDRPKTKVYFELVLLLLAFVFVVTIRIFLSKSRGFDEGIYLLVSKMMNEGSRIYGDFWVDKPPVIFLVNQIGLKIFGNSLTAITAWYSLVTAFASYLIYKVSFLVLKEKSRKLALAAAALWLIFVSLPLAELVWVMSETYLVIFELLTVFFLFKGFRLEKKQHKISMLLAGFFLFITFMIRPTGAVFILAAIVFYVAVKKGAEYKMFVLGFLLSVVAFALYLQGFADWHGFIYQVYLERFDFLNRVKSSIVTVKIGWFNNYLISAGPLWILALTATLSLKNRSFKKNAWLILLALWIFFTIVFYRFFGFAPGFGHEYAETLAPLSIISALGLKTISDYYQTNKKVVSLLIVAVLIITMVFSAKQNIDKGEWRSDDVKTLNEISDYFKQNIPPADNLFVLETKSAKIGPWIYFLTKSPSIIYDRTTLTVPIGELRENESNTLVTKLKQQRPEKLIIIGGLPPQYPGFEPVNDLYSYLMTNYSLEKKFSDYSPYPGRIENLPVELFHRVDPNNFLSESSLDLNKIIGAQKSVEQDGSIKISLNKDGSTVFYRFDEAANLEGKLISIDTFGNEDSQYLIIDLVDNFGNWSRAKVKYRVGDQNIHFNVSNYAFRPVSGAPADLDAVKQINIILPQRAETTTYTIDAINIFQ